MTKKEIIAGLKMTVDLFLFDPLTGEVLTKEHLNGESRITVEACEGAIAILEAALCGDCISRKAATDRFDLVQSDDKCMGYDDIMAFLSSLPPVEPERKTGHWIIHSDDLFPAESTQECDNCHHHQPLSIDDSFCPNCGIKMIGQKHGFGGDHG